MSKIDDAFPKSQHEIHNLRIIELLEQINSKLDTFGQVMLKQMEQQPIKVAKVKKP